jgi:hypothetical protein
MIPVRKFLKRKLAELARDGGWAKASGELLVTVGAAVGGAVDV